MPVWAAIEQRGEDAQPWSSSRLGVGGLCSCRGDIHPGRRAVPYGRLRSALAAILLFALAAPAAAQEKLINMPAEKFIIAPGGVDMRTGRFVYDETDLSIGGEGSGGLSLKRIAHRQRGRPRQSVRQPFPQLGHHGQRAQDQHRRSGRGCGQDFQINVHFGGRSQTYRSRYGQTGFEQMSSGAWAPLDHTHDRVSDDTVYTYKAVGGTVATFLRIGSKGCSGAVRCAFVSEIVEPDGTKFTFIYDPGDSSAGAARLVRVTSSRGYALLLEGTGNLVNRACVLNLATTPDPGNGPCPAGVPTATYGYAGGKLVSATGPDNRTSGFTYAPAADGKTAMGFVKPGQSAPWLTNIFHIEPDELEVPQEIVEHQAFADGQSYGYTYDHSPRLSSATQVTIAGGTYSECARRGHGGQIRLVAVAGPAIWRDAMPEPALHGIHQGSGDQPALSADFGAGHDHRSDEPNHPVRLLRPLCDGGPARLRAQPLHRPSKPPNCRRSRGDQDRPQI